MESRRRVVITGIGIVSCAGVGRDVFWRNAVEGRSSLGVLEIMKDVRFPGRVVGEIRGVDLTTYFANKKLLKMVGRRTFMCVAASVLMMEAARLKPDATDADDIGIYLGDYGAIEGDIKNFVTALTRARGKDGKIDLKKFGSSGIKALNPLTLLMNIPNAPTAHVSMQHNIRGLSNTFLTNFLASAQAIGEAAEVIRAGTARWMVAGGVGVINPLTLLELGALGLLCDEEVDPASAVRPFDAAATGLALAEGAVLLLLEDAAEARRRNALTHAELTGYGSSFEPSLDDMLPDERGAGIFRAMTAAIARAGLGPADVDCVLTSGVGHPAFDLAEGRAVRRLAEQAPGLQITSVTPVAGHLQGGMAALQVAAASMMLSSRIVPPIANHVEPQPALAGLPFVVHAAVNRDIRTVLVSSVGIGGQAASLVLASFD